MAIVRTKLANERTLLAYMRTFIGAFAAGVGFIKFTGDIFFVYTGFIMVSLAPFIMIFGVVRFFRVKRVIVLSLFDKISDAADGNPSDEGGDKREDGR